MFDMEFDMDIIAHHGYVAQSVRAGTHNAGVGGSIPPIATSYFFFK